ncbi:MFS transporter [Nesterenkonia sp. MY13]|uniref:MFS transporter n=1 Tax=Nesterenkonia sedimenti TaxID=1463632 RepID=A0A7X8YER4_9MICC|nr:MFS transporter [Nesterenkonia sedimenti]NLS10631.1 MFS transporter [Nesterenkonia sedimenti]
MTDPSRRVQRRTLAVVVISQTLGGAGLAAGVAVGALLAQQMLGSEGLAGLPTALFTLGSAVAAFLVGRFTQRWGRRTGLALGFGAGGLGALGVVAAAVADSPLLLFLSLFIYGSGAATNLQARYAGTDLAPEARRGTAISVAMVATTAGAVAGPNLVDPLGRLALWLGIPELAGPFLLAAVAYSAAGLVLFLLLRPDPYLLARELRAQGQPTPDEQAEQAPTATEPRVGPSAYIGASIMVLVQISMVAIMTMTPVHMRAHDHEMAAVGLVIGLHLGAMWLPSLITGYLVDLLGRIPMALAAGATLLASGVLAALAPGDSLGLLILALVLLGVGWNFGLIAGTALVVDGTVPENRPRTQGSIDVLVALAGAGGGAMSGIVMHHTSFAVLSLAGGLLALLFIPAVFLARRSRNSGVDH